ncbi:2Fe-2S iron-sulfur cluster-binding protein [Conexibacter woesei]|uniref:2Fe-2S iron-sulfur cluster-binding protein n=1 Tax=Conexibacter woesei TaxID=191495 RepID=UPI00042413B1|nr:2Fe-2S iron-sulfur cluster-binding protein [Conexibacter woesei]
MPTITYIEPGGEEHEVDVAAGTTIKDAAIANGIDGIVAECGGNAMCATCHVYVDPAWAQRLPAMEAVEDELLEDTASPREATSRLGCQVAVGDDLDGLVVRLPEAQE